MKTELMDVILSEERIQASIRRVKSNKGAGGIDKMTVKQLDDYFAENGERIMTEIRNKKYKPLPVRRTYIPKSNGKQRPLGIPVVADRVIQQSVAMALNEIYEPLYSDYSYGFRNGRDCHLAIEQALTYLNEGYEWIIDLDIEKYFDTVNHDKLISILREQVNDSATLHLIRSFLKAGAMENGVVIPTEYGVPQGGPLSPTLSNIYLDKFDKELESRGLRFVRYADDCNIFVKSEMAANRVMASVTGWLERKLFLKVNAAKTKVTRPTGGAFLGFTYWKSPSGWKCRPLPDRLDKLCQKCKELLIRKKAQATSLKELITKLNSVVRGWINYYGVGSIKGFLKQFSPWLRHKIRVVIVKQWKRPRTIYRNLMKLNRQYGCGFTEEDIRQTANTRLGLYRQCGMRTINYILSPKFLQEKQKDRPGLIDPLQYYLDRNAIISAIV